MPRFTEEVEAYHVLILNLGDFVPSTRELPEGFRFLEQSKVQSFGEQEKAMLQQAFDDWRVPYSRKLRGWRPDSPHFILYKDSLAGGLYLCAGNEFSDAERWGQLHYFFVAPKFRGRGLHSLLVADAMCHAKKWGLEGVYINTDRYGLPEVYERWGAKSLKVIPKGSRLPRTAWADVLRTAHSRWRALRRRARRV